MQWLERQRKEEHRPHDEQRRSPLRGQPLRAQSVEESLHDSGDSIRANARERRSVDVTGGATQRPGGLEDRP